MSQDKIEPINRGAIDASETRGPKELIQTEWKIIDKLQKLANNSQYEKHRTIYYQSLASHIRTLSILLKLHGQPSDAKDLATLLSEIRKKAKTLSKRLNKR